MSTQENDRRSENPARTSVSAVLAAMLLWGGWCFFTNAEAPWPARIGMALAQALASGVITGCLARGVTGAMTRWGRRPAACWLVPLSVVAVTGSALWLLHWALGTPALARTIAPPIVVAWSYCQWLAWREALMRRRAPHDADALRRRLP